MEKLEFDLSGVKITFSTVKEGVIDFVEFDLSAWRCRICGAPCSHIGECRACQKARAGVE